MKKLRGDLSLGNVCYHLVQNLVTSCLLSRNLKIKIYKTIILAFDLYGCVTWSFTLREECKLKVFKNRVQRRIFGPNKKEVAGGWRRLHSEELHNLYISPDIVRVVK
jgi:hypothetical protein